MKQQQCPPHLPPRELLLPQGIPEMHSRGVGQWGGGKRSNPSKEWNVSRRRVKNLGYMENIVRTDTHKGSCRKTGSYRQGQGREKAENKVRTYEGWGSNTQVCYQIWPLRPQPRGGGECGGGGRWWLWVRLTYPASGCWRLTSGWTGQLKGWT